MNARPNRFPLMMKSTAAFTAVVTAVLVALYRFCPQDWLLSTAISFGTTCYHFVMRLLVGAIVPRFSIEPNSSWFHQRAYEPKLYAALRVRDWKANMPTYNPDAFSLKHNTLEQIICNSCTAELVHTTIILFSFVPLFFAIPWDAFLVFLITSILAALYDSIFVIMQRFNRPRLVRILKKKEAKPNE